MVENALLTAQKNDPPLAPVGPYLHGPQGLFNRRDRSNPIFSAMQVPEAGVADAIPVYNGGRYFANEFGMDDWAFDSIITGQTAGDLDNGTGQPIAPCVDGPTAGLLKFCVIANTAGNYKMSTREVSDDRAGRVADMVDGLTAQVANLFPRQVFGTPTPTPSTQNAIANELQARIFEMTNGFSRFLATQTYAGDPANNSGEYREIIGLDMHINAGNKRDARNMTLCTAADSDVKNFGGAVVGSTTNIMRYIEMCDAYVTQKARRQGLGTPEYIVAMRPELWQEITEVAIPVQKYQRVSAVIDSMGTNVRANVDMNAAYNERNTLRSNLLIPVNGRMLRVVIDDTIAETSSKPGGIPTYASTIYGIPLTVLGGIPVTYWEYFNHDNNQAQVIQRYAGGFRWTSDSGMFKWTADFSKGCLKLNVTFTPRLRMRTTQLAWRIDNVACQPLQHFSSWDPTNSYFQNGGVTQGDQQSYYTSYGSTTPQKLW